MSYRDRSRCATCGHGFGVHSILNQGLLIKGGKVESFLSAAVRRETCTGYPDMLGGLCECRKFVRP